LTYLPKLQASAAWEEECENAREEENKKHREAAVRQPRTIGGKFSTVSVSPDTETAERPPKSSTRERDKVAQSAGVSSATAGRALTLVEKRPDLADRVQAAVMTLNEAMRLMKKDEVVQKAGELPEGKFRVFYADPPWQ